MLYCEHCSNINKPAWSNNIFEVKYYKNIYKYSKDEDKLNDIHYYTLSFVVTFHASKYFRLAYNQPYTYSHLLDFIKVHQPIPFYRNFIRFDNLCKTNNNRFCPLIYITDFTSPDSIRNTRRVIFLTSRVHPGEPSSSFVMEGIIEQLISTNSTPTELRKHFIFVIIPMLNPDGVAEGHSR